jgi:hypothetical protein
MEEELITFKKKIAYRYENSKIPKDFLFPRLRVEKEDLRTTPAMQGTKRQSQSEEVRTILQTQRQA